MPFSTNDELTELQAYMTASSDPETYGRLTVYEVEGTVRGPLSVAAEIGSAPDVAATITQQVAGDRSAEVSFGDLQLVPIGDGLLYVRPFYVARGQSAQRAVPRYEFITVWYDNDAAIGSTLGEALRELFPRARPRHRRARWPGGRARGQRGRRRLAGHDRSRRVAGRRRAK